MEAWSPHKGSRFPPRGVCNLRADEPGGFTSLLALRDSGISAVPQDVAGTFTKAKVEETMMSGRSCFHIFAPPRGEYRQAGQGFGAGPRYG